MKLEKLKDQVIVIMGVPKLHRSGSEEAGCMKHPAGKGSRPPGGRVLERSLPPGGRRLFSAVGFIPMDA